MASPHVAGVAALMKSVYPAMTPDGFDTFLKSGAITADLGATGRDDKFGYGLIDAYKAVVAANNVANGSQPTIPPITVATPTVLNFSSNLNTLTFTLSNGGSGAVNVTGISNDAGGWFSVSPDPSAYTNGLGTYTVTVNRNLVPDTAITTYTASITIANDANTLTVPVIMQLANAAYVKTAGHLYAVLGKTENFPNNSDTFFLDIGEPSNGSYQFIFEKISNSGIPPGDYYIVAGEDSNNDDNICGPGEACGGYPTLGTLSVITIGSDGKVYSDRNFDAGFSGVTSAANTGASAIIPPQGIPINKAALGQ